jgi:hypothetical protein
MLGKALRWEELDADFLVDGLRQGLYGNERWMKHLHERWRRSAGEDLLMTA